MSKYRILSTNILIVFFLIFSTSLWAQKENSWKLLSSDKGVTISYKILSCNSSEQLFFKLDNSSKATVDVNFSFLLNAEAPANSSDIVSFSQVLQANTSIEGSCVATFGTRYLAYKLQDLLSSTSVKNVEVQSFVVDPRK